MKLFHTSDWHLGRMLYGRSLLQDQQWFLEQVFLPAVERERPACVLIAGDIYDRQIAPTEAIRLFDSALSRLMSLGTKVCVISGNHDGAGRMALLKQALSRSGVYFATELSDALAPVLLEEGEERLQLFLLPYFDTAQAREFLGDGSLRGEGPCMERLLEQLLPLFDPEAGHVLLSHCFAAGAQTSDSESTLFVGGSGQVPPSLFDPFDYAALGHLHGPQPAGKKGRYSGSPLKYSVDEERQRKGYIQLEWDGAKMSQEFVPCSPLRDVRRVKGLFEDLLRTGEEHPCQDYVELVLEDSAPVMLAAERLRPFYPNLLSVSNLWMAATVTGERAAKLKGQDERTVLTSFLKEVCGTEAEPQDLALFQEVLEELRAE